MSTLQGWCADGIWRWVTGQQCVLGVFLCFCYICVFCKGARVCKGIFSILNAWKKSNCCYFNTIMLAKTLQNFPLSLQVSVIFISHTWICFFWKAGQVCAAVAVATLEPAMPSLNHITRLAQRRRKNIMQAFGWESWDGDKAFPGSLMAWFLFKGKNMLLSALKVR